MISHLERLLVTSDLFIQPLLHKLSQELSILLPIWNAQPSGTPLQPSSPHGAQPLDTC